MYNLFKVDDNKNLLTKEQSIQEEEILEKKDKATEGFDDDNLKGVQRVNLKTERRYMYMFYVNYHRLPYTRTKGNTK